MSALPFAVFDEFGVPCDYRVHDHFAALATSRTNTALTQEFFESELTRAYAEGREDEHEAMMDEINRLRQELADIRKAL